MDRFAVSTAISAKIFKPGVPVLYVASGEVFPDALSASAAAGKQGGPVLLVMKEAIPDPAVYELARLAPESIVVLGGTATISDRIYEALRKYTKNLTRIAGPDRFVVSAGVSAAVFTRDVPVAYVASGTAFPDALSGSAAAGRAGGPMLLTTKDSVPDAVMTELSRLHPGKIVVLGGSSAVSDDVVRALAAIAPVTRTAGADRFVVSATISAEGFPAGASTVYVASGAQFPDALSGSAAAIADKGTVLLTTRDEIPAPIVTELQRLKPTRIIVLGGVNSVSDAVLTKLADYVTE
ncbi:cell wall-binding repeat-containing protein [Herbiconiux ginsengi]|uniref:cell wall-binding repeat-containing protein n=1 Tax=Herbiconiux ginsengi TaxID=381665 RepID=UPI001587ADA2|nr:cell wall-binding repeat-containing protein [Herbiconiux ginsengi]